MNITQLGSFGWLNMIFFHNDSKQIGFTKTIVGQSNKSKGLKKTTLQLHKMDCNANLRISSKRELPSSHCKSTDEDTFPILC